MEVFLNDVHRDLRNDIKVIRLIPHNDIPNTATDQIRLALIDRIQLLECFNGLFEESIFGNVNLHKSLSNYRGTVS